MSLSHPLPHSLFFAVPPPLLPCGWACRYCGQPELLMAALLLHCPIAVYVRWAGAGPPAARPLRQIQVYGRQYATIPLYLLYSDGVHYDALLPAAARAVP